MPFRILDRILHRRDYLGDTEGTACLDLSARRTVDDGAPGMEIPKKLAAILLRNVDNAARYHGVLMATKDTRAKIKIRFVNIFTFDTSRRLYDRHEELN